MKKIIMTVFGVFVSLSLLIVTPSFAKGPSAPAGKSNIAHLNLYQKNLSDWSIVPGGANGKMTYNQSGPAFDYVFNGHGLVPGDDYTLIYYPDPWPGTNLRCLGTGTANGGGNVNISGAVATGSLPTTSDANYNWNMSGTWNFDVVSTIFPGTYPKTMTISQDSSGNITGTGANVPAGFTWNVTGTISGSSINFALAYDAPMSGYVATFTGNIQTNGTMNGTWTDVWYSDSGSWNSTSGTAASPGAKIWLVESGDVECEGASMMTGWNPTSYLFENNLINFTYIP